MIGRSRGTESPPAPDAPCGQYSSKNEKFLRRRAIYGAKAAREAPGAINGAPTKKKAILALSIAAMRNSIAPCGQCHSNKKKDDLLWVDFCQLANRPERELFHHLSKR